MSHEIDPEVLADLQLRSYSQHDRTRTRGAGVYNWQPPAFVDSWPCRSGCGAMIQVTEEALHALDVHNRELHHQREAPIDTAGIVFCDACMRRVNVTLPGKRRKQVDGLAEKIRELKADPPPDGERERTLIEQIRMLHHPDVEGLVLAIRLRRESKQGAKRSKGNL